MDEKLFNANKYVRTLYFYEIQGKCCYYCKRPLYNGEDFIACDLDHKQPTSRGGKTEMSNLCLSCQVCNSRKSDMNEYEYGIFLDVIERGLLGEKEAREFATYIVLREKYKHIEI